MLGPDVYGLIAARSTTAGRDAARGHGATRRPAAGLAAGMCLLMAVAMAGPTGRADETPREHLLFQAIRRGDVALLENLLRGGTPPTVRDESGTTPLHAAALYGNAETVKVLLAFGADARAVNQSGVTPLLWGATDVEKVKLLLARGADPDARSALGNSPLIVAAAAPAGAAAVEQLLAHGADILLRSKGGRNALRAATAGGDVATVRLLLDKAKAIGKLEQLVREAGPTVAIAAGNGFTEIVDLLLAHGADPNQPNGSRGHGLNAALLAGQTEIAGTLIRHGSDLDRRVQPGDVPTPLLAAYTEVDDPSLVTLLRDHGADFTAMNQERETALTWARLRGHRQLIDRLVAAGVPAGELPEKPTILPPETTLDSDHPSRQIVEAVQKSLALLQLASDTFLDVRSNCVSCHHQNLPGVALAWARDRGFPTRDASLGRMIDRQVASWRPRVARSFELDSPYPVPPSFLGYGMWMFAELGYRPDDLTRAVSWYLAATQQADGHWVPGMLRPPLGGDAIQATALALRTLQLYPVSGRETEMAERMARGRRWLEAVEPRTHEQNIYRLLGLAWSRASGERVEAQVQQLLSAQRADGGWAQLPGLDSDAWATGQALVALHISGRVPADHPACRRGREQLLRTQLPDGSWYVQTRSWPFQPYFESNFPYGRDQWISAPATAWAVMALVTALRPDEVSLGDSQGLDAPAGLSAQPTVGDAAAAQRATPRSLPGAARQTVDFVRDIKPLLARSCAGCHGDKEPESNFSVLTRAALIRGGDSDLPAVVPGVSQDSPLVRFAAGLIEKMEMPPLKSRSEYPPLSPAEIGLLRAWIDQGATWPDTPAAP